jgi:heme/copper-type cytochrome/quinol oxidase subunit 3
MLAYVLTLPRYEPVDRPPHRPFHNAALYWHFVDFIWIWIIIFLYIGPNTR